MHSVVREDLRISQGCHMLVAGWSSNAVLSVNIKTAHTWK